MGALVGLYLVAQFTASQLGHNLLAYHDVGLEPLQVGEGVHAVVICVYGINLSEVGCDEIEEVLVVIHNCHHIFLCL